MSRVIVKKIGKNVNEAQLRELFSQKGEVTDVKIARKPDGSSRMFAFVGFRTELQATEAQKYFNNTFIGLSRISVEIARKLNDKELEERKEKFSKETKTKMKELKEKVKRLEGNGSENEKDDSKDSPIKAPLAAKVGKHKDEFMELVGSRNKNKVWANDDLATKKATTEDEQVESDNDEDVNDISGSMEIAGDSDDESGSAENDDDDSDDDSAIDLDELIKKNNYQQNNKGSTTVVPAVKSMSDLDYLRSKVTKAFSDSDDSDNSDDDKEDDKAKESEEEVEEDNNENDELKEEQEGDKKEGEGKEEEELEEDDARLYVKNLPFTCTEDELRSLFEVYGKVTEVHIPLSSERKGKGFGYVTFLFPDNCERALEELHGSSFQGRVLYIAKAMKPVNKALSEANLLKDLRNKGLSSFQIKKEEERRKQANRKEGWNAAFVRSDAVVESLAEQYGVEKSAIMDTTLKGGDMAIRLAIGESQVIQENKDYFLSHGVDLNALESLNSNDKVTKRSTTTLLIKNLPPDTVPDEIESMFTKFGSLSAFLVPKSKTVAVVDYFEPSEARAAFKGLAYRRYKNSPLYLEWAPLGVINMEKLQKKQQSDKEKVGSSAASSSSSSGSIQEKEAAPEDNLDDFSTLFIKNLNFITTDETLLAHIRRLGVEGLRTVNIQKKMKGTTILSQGFGFAEFQNAHYASVALQKINGSMLDSHKLEVKPSEKRLTQAPTNATKKELKKSGVSQQSAKLIVRNLAFQATKSELRQLFSAFGSVKTVRIPKKMGGNHRGFAFVDFATNQEAANAMVALKSTHLYGRHLVIEWAKEEEDDGVDIDEPVANALGNKSIEASRKRAARDSKVIAATNQKAKRQKTVDGDGEDGDGEMNDLV